MAAHSYKIFIYTALPCEAKPLVDHFKLKKNTAVQPFAVYGRQDLCLMVTGPGKCAMSAGVAYSQALFSGVEPSIAINIGIAGHRDQVVGSVFLIDKITDLDSRKNYYPPLVFTPACPTGAVQTASTAQLDYARPDLFDMEASAFYDTATRFTSAELVHSLKVVSDNRTSPASQIKPQQVSALIAAQIQTLEATLRELSRLAALIAIPESGLMTDLLKHCHFTANEQRQLKNLLNRWHCLSGNQNLEFDRNGLHRSSAVLCWLEQKIAETEFFL